MEIQLKGWVDYISKYKEMHIGSIINDINKQWKSIDSLIIADCVSKIEGLANNLCILDVPIIIANRSTSYKNIAGFGASTNNANIAQTKFF